MIPKPDQETAKKIQNLKNTDSGRALLEWLQKVQTELANGSLTAMDDNRCRQIQGGAIALKEICVIINRRP